jgi:hypothetical protein
VHVYICVYRIGLQGSSHKEFAKKKLQLGNKCGSSFLLVLLDKDSMAMKQNPKFIYEHS